VPLRVLRVGADPGGRRAAGGAFVAAGLQIGQFWRKRLWRQKLGGIRRRV
jgi:hypothetical protein